jgi:hypothetical protein
MALKTEARLVIFESEAHLNVVVAGRMSARAATLTLALEMETKDAYGRHFENLN